MGERSDEKVPVDERLYDALLEALGMDESDAQAALDAVLPLVADDLRALAAQVEWRFRAMTFRRGGCDSTTRLHPAGDAIREHADQVYRPGTTGGDDA